MAIKRAIPISENTWFIEDELKTLGVLYQSDTDYVYISPDERIVFASFDAAQKDLGNFTIDDSKPKKMLQDINGYPIRHEQSFDHQNNEKPTYLSVEGSKVRYYAGYWGVKFKNSNKYLVSLCPKVVTIEENESVGPYKERLDCLAELNILNQRLKADNDEEETEYRSD